jgi:signal transduction histidine kinase
MSSADAASDAGMPPPGVASTATASELRPQRGLFRKYIVALVLLVAAALCVNVAVEFWFGYRESKAALLALQQEKADAAAQRIGEFVTGVERQIGWTTLPLWGAAPIDQRRFDFVRLLRQVPAITDLTELDGDGKEQLKVSRLAMDVVGSGADYSHAPEFVEARANGSWVSPVFFRKESEPYMTLALADAGHNSGVTVASINLKLIWDVITALKIGEGGYAYVVDGRGKLLADPDISLVLRDTDFSKLPQVAAVLAAASPDGEPAQTPTVSAADDYYGRPVLSAHARIKPVGWRVFVEVPLKEAYAPLYALALRNVLWLLLALVGAALAAFLLARRMIRPIHALQAGAAQIGAGALDRRIDIHTGDELEVLAEQFNHMAADLETSYAELEQKVEARTAELSEALEQQTATAEVLGVINSSPGNLQPVFDAMLEKALALCGAALGVLFRYDGARMNLAAMRGQLLAADDRFFDSWVPGPGDAMHAMMQGASLVQVPDIIDTEAYRSGVESRVKMAEVTGARTALWAPLRKDDVLLGVIVIYRREVRPFGDKQIALIQNFAAQAVIAIENARLIAETQEALDQQTATAEVLQIINSSPGDLAPVFDAILEKAMRLCGVEYGDLELYDGTNFRAVATYGLSDAFAEQVRRGYPGADSPATRPLIAGERLTHIADLAAADFSKVFIADPAADEAHQTLLCVPLQRDGRLLGMIASARKEVRPFSEKEIALLENFAAQAVVAMDNARLLDEIRHRQAELRVTFDNMGDGVAMFDAEHRLAAWNRNFQQILNLPDEFVAPRPALEEYIRYLAEHGEYGSVDVEAEVRRVVGAVAGPLSSERTRPDGRVIELRNDPVPGGGFVLMYRDITERKHAEAEIREARDAAETALGELKTAQASLIQAEKMASLGQLTAGIAHEIKNPLNFVNNFASLSNELLGELKEIAAPALQTLDDDARADFDETMAMLSGNLGKIAEHGKRADNIVKSMLEHSRVASGERRAVDLNALVEEALNLAYHGARAQEQSFNITLERDFDAALRPIELVPQDMTRVFLNLIGNGFYAANKRAQKSGNGFRPVLKVATCETGNAVEVRIRDNGTGIPADIRDKLFQPFFTTKPTGEGTGLGLSISYDIVTQQHGGTIAVDSAENEFTEFTIRLPRGPATRAMRRSP